MNKQFFLLFFVTGITIAGYEGLPKTQLLEKQLQLNLSHHNQWTRRIDGGSSSSAIKILKKQYELLLEDVEVRARPHINRKVRLEQEEMIQCIDEQDPQSYLPSYEYWQTFAKELVDTCAEKERKFIEELKKKY